MESADTSISYNNTQESQELITNRSKAGQKQEKQQKKREFRDESPPPLRDNTIVPYKTIFLSFLLFFAGILFSVVGYEETMQPKSLGIKETYPYFLMSLILLIPGVYHVFIIIMIWLNVGDFNYEMLGQVEN